MDGCFYLKIVSGATWDSLIPLKCPLTSTANVRHVETNYFWTNFNFSLKLVDEPGKVDQGRFPANGFSVLEYLFVGCLLGILLASIFACMSLICCVYKTSPSLSALPPWVLYLRIFVAIFFSQMWTGCLLPWWINGKALFKKFSPVADNLLLHISSGLLTIRTLFTSLTLVQPPMSLAALEQLLCLCLRDVAEGHDNDGLNCSSVTWGFSV